MIAEVNLPVLIPRRQENAPAVLRHANVSEIRPAVPVYADRRSQIDLQIRGVCRPGLVPPGQECRLPAFERTLQIRLKTRRAVVECWITARHWLKHIGILRPRYRQVLRFHDKAIREPRPTTGPFAVSSFTRCDVDSISHIGADISIVAFDVR